MSDKVITKDTLICEALKIGNAQAIEEVLLDIGMHCVRCPHSSRESIAQAAAVHGVDADDLVKALQEAANSK